MTTRVSVPEFLARLQAATDGGVPAEVQYQAKTLLIELKIVGYEGIGVSTGSLRDYYRRELPPPPGAVVEDGWVKGSMELNEFLRWRAEVNAYVAKRFRQDLTKARIPSHPLH